MKPKTTAAANSALTKLTARFFAPMYADFDRQMADALLRRDAFLDRVIANEIKNVSNDLVGLMLSPKANSYIAGRLKAMGGKDAPPLKQVSIAVRPSTADALRALTEEHNLVRDALINWIVVLLRSSDKLLDWLELPKRVNRWTASGTEDMPTSPIRAIEETQWDPFYYLRSACLERHGCGLYALPLPPQLHGMACYLPDGQVPHTTAFEARVAKEAEERDLLLGLDDFEANLPPIAGKKGA
jgi:hypothetical protein